MSAAFDRVRDELRRSPRTWLVTGAAGFIGSHLVQALLRLDQRVTGLDNFATGRHANLEDVRLKVGESAWRRFEFIEGDIRDATACAAAARGAQVVLHQAALGSIPRSLADPLATHETNTTGLIHILLAARDAGVSRVIYASSSSVYGDSPDPVRREPVTGAALSPYAASKRAGELYAAAFQRSFGLRSIGLRYFNVFGPRQDPEGAYAAVIPRWARALLSGEAVHIHGDGQTSRDFCFVDNVVQANLLAATAEVSDDVLNIGTGIRTSLNELFDAMRESAARHHPGQSALPPVYGAFRAGDVRHSQADIGRAREALGYGPSVGLSAGLAEVFGSAGSGT